MTMCLHADEERMLLHMMADPPDGIRIHPMDSIGK